MTGNSKEIISDGSTAQTLNEKLKTYLFGDDVFISYARADASDYARALADRLGENEFLCFIDQYGTDIDDHLPERLKRKLRRSTVLVLIGSQAAVESEAIRKEIELFKTTERAIIPIDVDGAFQNTDLRRIVRGLPIAIDRPRIPEVEATDTRIDGNGKDAIAENPEAFLKAVPSDGVIDQIEHAYTYNKRTQKQRRLLLISTGVLSLLIASSIIFLIIAIKKGAEAATAISDATAANHTADVANSKAEDATGKALASELKQQLADIGSAVAQANAEQAAKREQVARGLEAIAKGEKAHAEADRDAARTEANKQLEMAQSLRLANESETLRTRDPGQIALGVLLAAESAQHLILLNSRSPEIDHALRSGLDVLPRLISRLPEGARYGKPTLTADGSYLITSADSYSSSPAVWSPADGKFIANLDDGGQRASVLAVGPIETPSEHYAITASQSKDTATVWRLDAGTTMAILKHQGRVRSANFSADGAHVVTASDDHNVRIWRASDGTNEAILPHPDAVRYALFSPKMNLIATACADSQIYLWEKTGAGSWQIKKTFRSDPFVETLLFSLDEEKLVVATNKDAQMIQLESGRVISTMRHRAGDELIAGADDKYLYIAGPDAIQAFEWERGFVSNTAFTYNPEYGLPFISDNGRYVWVGMDDIYGQRTAELRWLKTNRQAAILRHPDVPPDDNGPNQNYVNSIAVGGRFIATHLASGKVFIWENPAYDGDLQLAQQKAVLGVFFTPDKLGLKTIGRDNTVRLWNTNTGQEVPSARVTFASQDDILASAVPSPNRTYLGVVRNDGTWVLDGVTGAVKHQLSGDRADEIVFSPNELLVAFRKGQTVTVMRTTNWYAFDPLRHENGSEITKLAFSPDGNYLITGSKDGLAVSWRTDDWHPVAHSNNEGEVRAIAFSPDSEIVATASEKDEKRISLTDPLSYRVIFAPTRVHVWRVTSGQDVIPPVSNGVRPNVVALSDKYLAAGGTNGVTVVVDLRDGKQLGKFTDESEVTGILFSPSGSLMATLSNAGVVRVRDTQQWQLMTQVSHADTVFAAAFSPDEKRLATASRDRTTRLWQLQLPELLRETCVRLQGRSFTPDEWNAHFEGHPYESCQFCKLCKGLSVSAPGNR